ncbi:MAG: hypothetical protein BMS9Abin37_2989 [Acidobacteriota bacterium]|nr:MAG: hypothetical protein BMS9Abin37_2989 [Acidobacteriota bacterium]
MAKPTNSSSREFLAQRRKAIAEMANRRRQQQLVRGSGVSVGDASAKTLPPISLRSAAPPSHN